MGAMKETAWEFCEMVYPGDYDKQDILFGALTARNPSNQTINPVTIEEFRKFYEKDERWPLISFEDLETMMKEGKTMVVAARSNLTNIVISAVEEIATASSEEKKIVAADALIAAIRQVVKEEMAKENPVYA